MKKGTKVTVDVTNMGISEPETSAKGTPYQEAKLYDFNQDTRKDWVIEFYVWDETKGKLTRKLYKKGLNGYKDPKDRMKAAKAIMKELNRLLALGHRIQATAPAPSSTPQRVEPKILEVFRAFIERQRGRLSEGHVRNYETVFAHLAAFMPERSGLFCDFGAETAYGFVDYLRTRISDRTGKPISNKTSNNYLNDFKTFLNDCKRRKIIAKSPLEDLDELNEESEKYLPFSEIQAKQFFEVAESKGFHQLITFVQFLYYTFMRPGKELRLLQAKHIEKDKIFVPSKNAKNDKNEWVEISEPLEELIQKNKFRELPPETYIFGSWGTPSNEPSGKKHFYEKHKAILDEMGLGKNYSLYGWKHTGNIALYRAGVGLIWIQRQNRHKTLAQTETYLVSLGVIENNQVKTMFPRLK